MRTETATHHDYWDSFYASRASAAIPQASTDFARWVRARLRRRQVVAELGFGTGRDALWFARHGHRVIGFDFAETAVRQARGHAAAHGLPASFSVLDLYDRAAVDVAVEAVGGRFSAPAVYGRFLLHALEEAGRQHVLDLAAGALPHGGELYLEFRTGLDRDAEHAFGDEHFRAYLEPEDVAEEIARRGGVVVHAEAGRGRAVYKTEDPHVARLVARWAP